ncbi:hypothetical protein D3C76_1431760 [compost metagenome]
MNITINVNITFQPATETAQATPAVEQPTLENTEAKTAMIIRRLAYRQRIAACMRAV